MPGYKSRKNLRKSKNKSKTGGRRRKYTVKKVRRGRKVMRGGGDIVTFDDLEKKLTEKKENNAMGPFLRLFSVGDFGEFKQDVWDEYKVEDDDKINIKKIIDDYFSDIGALDENAKNLELKRLALNNITEDEEALLKTTLEELQKS